MTDSRMRILGGAAAVAAAGAMLLGPAVAHADGTKDKRFSEPPKTSQPKDSKPKGDKNDDGTAPLNDRRAELKQCPGGHANGGYSDAPSYYPFELGKRGPNSFRFTFDAINIPDKFDVLYEGKVIATTGWRGAADRNDNNHNLRGVGAGSMTVNVPAGRSSQIEVRVTTDTRGTEWSFNVACPQ